MFALPKYGEELTEVHFPNLAELEKSITLWEGVLQNELIRHDYNTFTSSTKMYQKYKETNEELIDFIRNYEVNLNPNSMTCVGMSLSLIESLTEVDPVYGPMFATVSCEEKVLSTKAKSIKREQLEKCRYHWDMEDLIKEHMLVCLKFSLDQEKRRGYLLFDAGYHISRTVVVMSDSKYPHTGWFVGSQNERVIRQHNYSPINGNYIACKVREVSKKDNTINGEQANIIYVERKLVEYSNTTEKRSFIFKLKSYVVRNRKRAIAGIYGKISTKNLAIFYEKNDDRVTKRFTVDDLKSEEFRKELANVAAEIQGNSLPLESKIDQLMQMLFDYKEMIENQGYIEQILDFDEWLEDG